MVRVERGTDQRREDQIVILPPLACDLIALLRLLHQARRVAAGHTVIAAEEVCMMFPAATKIQK